jgi:hypothetical protein
MHDPHTLITDIRIPFTGKKNKKGGWNEYPYSIASIWHLDPEVNGDESSCGWYMRAHHGDKEVYESIKKEFELELKFLCNSRQTTYLSFTLTLFYRVLYAIYKDWNKVHQYTRKHLEQIILFSNNPTDSIDRSIDNLLQDYRRKYLSHDLEAPKEYWKGHAEHFASVIYGQVLRDIRPWYKHPRWHIHHWKITIHPIQALKRALFSRCEVCGKKFKYGDSNVVSSSWYSTGPQWFKSETNLRHMACQTLGQQIAKTVDFSKLEE